MADQRERLGQSVGDYRLVEWLGGGGSGNVYLAEHLHTHALVALKILNTRLTKSDDWRSFLNEARMFRLHHPHILPLLDFGLSRQDEPFLVMDYAPRGTLRDRHPKGSRVPLPTIVEYATQVGSALQYAHEQRLIHRDVKPENMLVRSDDTLLLSDFGIATAAHSTNSLTMNPSVSGTVPYMAPEQSDGKPHPASDQYALAVVIYEWLTGRCPFVGTVIEVVIQHTTKPPPSLLKQVPGLPPEVEQVLFKALAKDPRDRFVSVQAFIDALQQASASPTLLLPTPSTPMEPPTLLQPPPTTPMEPPTLLQPPPHIPAPPPTPSGFPSSWTPSQAARVPTYSDNGMVSSQPDRQRRNLMAYIAVGVVTLLAGTGAAVAFARFGCTCNGNCVDLKNDFHNCGSCGHVCGSGTTCVNGVCTQQACPSDQIGCNGTCTNLNSDNSNCGGCGHICGSETACVNGACQHQPCPSGQTDCNGTCTNLNSDNNNCGSCGNACPSGQTCVNRTCQRPPCPSGQTDCSGTCTNLNSDNNNCGSCGNACPSGQTCVNGTCKAQPCPSGQTDCSGTCINLNSDNSNCGKCGNACGSGTTCANGTCQRAPCPSGQTNCNGACVDTNGDPKNCGACGKTCPSGQICVNGTCKTQPCQCPSGQTCCSGVCVNTSNDPKNCGACGKTCPSGQICVNGACCPSCNSICCPAGTTCSNGKCCPPGQTNCGGTCCPSGSCLNGTCCPQAQVCGQTCCPSGSSCSNGKCCPSGQTNCGGVCVNTSNDPNNCGSCGLVCPSGSTCSGGACL
jgi:serine/threonine protein kinase